MPSSEPEPGNLWLARALWDSGGVLFGQFDIGATVDSPIYVNVRRIISNPRALRQIGDLITDETRMLGGMLRPHIQPFELVAGVPLVLLLPEARVVLRVKAVVEHLRGGGFGWVKANGAGLVPPRVVAVEASFS